jgi:type I restriction enzyme, S subunit
MIDSNLGFPRAFAVWFKDLDRWDASSFHGIKWHWPSQVMTPIGGVLRPRKHAVDRNTFDFSDLQPITIHFDGSVDKRILEETREYSMDLWFAHPGDIVVAKIDLKNGAVGIIPASWKNVVVTGHFAVYEPDRSKLMPEYFLRIVQAKFFRDYLWRNKVGAEGRKEVKLKFFEKILIPLPSLANQEAIVAHWNKAQKDIANAQRRIESDQERIPRAILSALGIPYREWDPLPRVFAADWKDLERWSVGYLARNIACRRDLKHSTYGLVQLGDFADIAYGVAKSPTNRPGKFARPYLRVANVQKGELDLSKIKTINVPLSEFERFRLRRDDLLVCEGNSADLVGRPAIWNDEIPDCVHQNHILRVRVDTERALPQFVLEYMHTRPARNYFRARAKFTTNLASINSNDLRQLPVPLPPLAVQERIMKQIIAIRVDIVREKAKTGKLANEISPEVEALILGTKKVNAL